MTKGGKFLELDPIEPHLRAEEPAGHAALVVRGGPLAAEKLAEHARRQSRAFSYCGRPMFSVSADATVAGWTLEVILSDRLWSRSTYATCTVGLLREAGYKLLPTHQEPHFDILLPGGRLEDAAALLALFGETLHNPYKRRTQEHTRGIEHGTARKGGHPL